MTGSEELGPAPVLDFDGTLVDLDVDWSGLRQRLGVASIEQVLAGGPSERWHIVTEAEVEAAARAVGRPPLVDWVRAVAGCAVLTANSEQAVARWLRSVPEVAGRVRVVVGRETLAGSKRDRDRFRAGFRRCVEATAGDRGGHPLVYVGDQDYELGYAAELGARAIDARTLGRGAGGSGAPS